MGLVITLPYGPVSSDGGQLWEESTDSSNLSKNVKVIKLTSYNNEVADVFDYATKVAETLETTDSTVAQPEVPSGESLTTSDESFLGQPEEDLTFTFTLRSINLFLYADDRKPESALGRLELVKFGMHLIICSNSTLSIECAVSDLRLEDMRHTREKTGIRTMLAKS